MIKAIIPFLVLLCMSATAQTNRFIYLLNRKIHDAPQKDYMVLDVNPHEVKFYDMAFLKSDSLTQKSPGHTFRTVSSTKQVLKRGKGSNAHLNFFTNNDADYFMLPTEDRIQWNITPETKKSPENYLLQKAKTRFGGRDWIAWFAKDIPVNEGPYKFHGLPGLIYELYDTEKKFHYLLVRNQILPETFPTDTFLETYYGKNPVKINQKQLEKIMLDDFRDPVAYLTKILKEGGSVNINGENISSIPQLDQKRKTMQESILKYHLPIEPDKAISYPMIK